MKNQTLKKLNDFKSKQVELPRFIIGGASGGQSLYYQSTMTYDNCSDENEFGDGPKWGFIRQSYMEQP